MISRDDFNKVSKCPICGGKLENKYKNIIPIKEFRKTGISFTIIYCRNCRLGILDNQIKKGSLNKIYSNNYLKNYRNKNFKKSSLTCVEKLKYLEIGVGTGDHLISRLNTGKFGEGWGVDINSRSFKKIKKCVDGQVLLNLLVGDISEIKLPKNHFDFIYLSHVIEHVHDPLGVIRKLYSVLKEGGKIQITTPNLDSLTNILMGNRADYSCPNHLYFFSKTSMEKIFKKLKIKNYVINHNWGNTLANRLGEDNKLVKILLTPMSILGEVVTRKMDNLEIVLEK